MRILHLLQKRFESALQGYAANPSAHAQRVSVSREPALADYQANIAMALAGEKKKDSLQIANDIVGLLQATDICDEVSIAGKGFINLRLSSGWLCEQLEKMSNCERLLVEQVSNPKNYVVDYSSPNVAKPMHVGHIRSTVIGDAITKILRFVGHKVISDNHLGDWGTQFGMIIYGYKHFRDENAFNESPVKELSRLYRVVQGIIGYQGAGESIQIKVEELRKAKDFYRKISKDEKTLRVQAVKISRLKEDLAALIRKRLCVGWSFDSSSEDIFILHRIAVLYWIGYSRRVSLIDSPTQPFLYDESLTINDARGVEIIINVLDELLEMNDVHRTNEFVNFFLEISTCFSRQWSQHTGLDHLVLQETAKLHFGDEENNRLWKEFVPSCLDEIHRVYNRLGIQFDYELGESFYHDMLGGVVDDLVKNGMAVESNGAICVFLDGFDAPMVIRKQDGAFLYSTTDIATVKYRLEQLKYGQEHFKPDAILYVVDHRQSDHFQKLFAALRQMGIEKVELTHVAFGTVLGKDGKPFKTRSGDVVGLDSMLDEAVGRAFQEVKELPVEDSEKENIAEVVGLGAIKYADLMHSRDSDYEFDMEKMVKLTGHTAPYIQYSYARTQGILRKGEITPDLNWTKALKFKVSAAAERDLAIGLLKFDDVLHQSMDGYYPSVLAAYIYDLAKLFASFYDQCNVLNEPDAALRLSRLGFVHLTGRTLKKGLELLGISTVDRM